ncbi:unnamed protein product [Ixodes persulcatus]
MCTSWKTICLTLCILVEHVRGCCKKVIVRARVWRQRPCINDVVTCRNLHEMKFLKVGGNVMIFMKKTAPRPRSKTKKIWKRTRWGARDRAGIWKLSTDRDGRPADRSRAATVSGALSLAVWSTEPSPDSDT